MTVAALMNSARMVAMVARDADGAFTIASTLRAPGGTVPCLAR
jgi:hypothetical protein